MKIKITSRSKKKWFVAYYGTGGIVNVEEVPVGNFFELTDYEFKKAKKNIEFIDPNTTRLFIPRDCAEVLGAVS